MGSLQILNPSLQLRKLVYDLRRLRFCRATTIEILKPTLLSCGVISEASVCKFICLCGVWSVSAASGKFRLRLLVNDFLNEPEPEASWSHHSAVIKCWKFNLVQKEQGLYRWTGSTWELVVESRFARLLSGPWKRKDLTRPSEQNPTGEFQLIASRKHIWRQTGQMDGANMFSLSNI